MAASRWWSGAIWACAANAFGPFYHVFMFEQLHYSAFEVSVFTTLSQLGGALSMPAWGQLLDRHGNRPVMAVSLALWQLNNLLSVLYVSRVVSNSKVYGSLGLVPVVMIPLKLATPFVTRTLVAPERAPPAPELIATETTVWLSLLTRLPEESST